MRMLRALALSVASLMMLTACDFDVYSLPLPGGADVGDNSYAVTVQFRDVLDLVPQSAVKVDDVTVGKVEEISLDGYTAIVKLRLNGSVKLPENSWATIRQTSLLGEKFVSLAPAADEQATGRLSDGDTIPLSRSGRNPEVEEVLGALSLLLNGGGVAQLRTIARELNKALTGNEPEIRSVLFELDTFMTQLDENKADIVAAIRSVNALSIAVTKQKATIITTLDQLPQALQVLDEQRTGLKKMLRGLKRLSPVAIRVIKASKADTVANLRALDPILTQVANAGDAIPKSLQLLLTYPFPDAAVGNTPTEARNLHQGDYTNLSAQLDLDLNTLVDLPDLPDVCDTAPQLPICNPLPDPCDVVDNLPLPVTCPPLPPVPPLTPLPTDITTIIPTDITTIIPTNTTIITPVVKCLRNPNVPKCFKVIEQFCQKNPASVKCGQLLTKFCDNFPNRQECDDVAATLCDLTPLGCDPDGEGPGVPDVPLPDLNDPGCTTVLCRPPTQYDKRRINGFDEDLALLLMQGVMER